MTALATILFLALRATPPASAVPASQAPQAGAAPAATAIQLANQALARRIELRPYLHTVALENRLSGHRFPVESEEFGLHLEGRKAPLTSRDFVVVGAPAPARDAAAETITVKLRHPATGIEVEVEYRLATAAFWSEKRLTIHSPGLRVNDVDVERFQLPGLEVPATPEPPPLGWPLFVGRELFLGLEFPAAHNEIDGEGRIMLRHFPGRSGDIHSKTAVLGVAPDRVNDRVRDRFFAYLDQVRARPVKRFTVWDTYHNDDDDGVRERFAVARDCLHERGVRLDAALMDGGWTDPRSVMKVNPERAERPALVAKLARESLDSRLGLHVITSGGRATVDHAWLGERYDMLNPVSYCLADPRVAAEQDRTLLEYVRTLDVAAYKFDWANFNCDRAGHRGHRPGLDYGREAISNSYAYSLDTLRRARPQGIFLYDAGWDSPWWLLHEDAVFSGEGDYNTTLSGPPSLSEADLETTWRDGVLARNFRDRDAPFPLSSLMNHGPVNWGWDNWANKPANSLDRFTDGLLMNYLRGTQLIEYCLNLGALDAHARDALAAVAAWAERNDDVLLAGETRFLLGDPRRAEVYGYSHFSADGRGLVGIRNPAIRPGQVRLELDESSGMRADAGPCWVSVVYPYLETLPAPVRFGDAVELPIASWETMVVSVQPVKSLRAPIPLGVRYELEPGADGRSRYRILRATAALGEAQEIAFSDGLRRHVDAPVPEPGVLATSVVETAPGELRMPDPRSLHAEFQLERPRHSKARVVAIQWVGSVAEQPIVTIRLTAAGHELESGRTVASSRAPQREESPGWVMNDAWVDAGGTIAADVRSAPDPRVTEFFAALPFECDERCEPAPGQRLPFELWLLSEEPLRPSPAIELPVDPAARSMPWGLPSFAQRTRREARLIASRADGVTGFSSLRRVFPLAVGAKPYTDREYHITRLPKELVGLPTIQFSHQQAKTDSSLAFRARVPIRVYVAFGPPSAADQWLDPEPGWQLFRKDGFASDIPDVSGDVYRADFAPGAVSLFAGHHGNWVLLGIAALDSGLPR